VFMTLASNLNLAYADKETFLKMASVDEINKLLNANQ
jgi:hypothetical protein